MQVKKQQLELDMEQWTGSKLGKKYAKAVLSPCLFKFYTEYIMRHVGLDEAQAGIKIAGKEKKQSEVAQLCPNLWTVTYQASLSMGFSRQEY